MTADPVPAVTAGRRGRIAHWVLVVVAAVVAAMVAVSVVTARGDVGPGRVSLHGRWSVGPDTAIAIPPLGQVVFDTHRTPLAVEARIDEIDPVAAEELAVDEGAVDRFADTATGDLRALVVAWAWRAVVVAALAGAAAGALAWPRRVRPALVGGATGALAVTILLGATWLDFSRTALRDPEYRGALERAPEVLAAIDRTWGGIDAVPGRIRAFAANLTELYATVGSADGIVADTSEDVRILHVSDVHSNPIGLELVHGLATGFDVDAIVDTGDLTSFGLPIESRIGTLLSDMPAPYYFVPGNHDTRANRLALDGFPNVTLVDDELVEIGDVRLLGFADPAITADGGDSDDEANAKRDAQAPRVARRVAALQPDVLAVATARQAADAVGDVPLVITGNSHRRSDRVVDGTRVLTVGSAGASGLGALTESTDQTYEAQVLHFRDGRLVVVDYVTFTGVAGDSTISRTVVPERARTSPSTTSPSTTSPTTTTTGPGSR